MLYRRLPLPVKFICGFIYPGEEVYIKARGILERKFGKIDFESEVINFNFTDYYYKEMGQPLFRKFVSFSRLRDPADFVKIKLFCLRVEKKFSCRDERKINIDPGYIDEAKLVLTTTKDFHHRIYLGSGIYAEVTLYYRDGNFQDFPTTYPDYRTSQHKNIFIAIRENYRFQVKNAPQR